MYLVMVSMLCCVDLIRFPTPTPPVAGFNPSALECRE